MATMRFHDEVVQPEQLDGDVLGLKPPRLEKRELEMAEQLIASLSGSFDAPPYRDEYREELLELLQQKADGKQVISAPSEEPTPTKAPDLMAALEEPAAARRTAASPRADPGRAKSASGAKARSTSPSKSEGLRPSEGRPGQGEVVSGRLQRPQEPRARRPAPSGRRGDGGHRRRPSAEAHQPRQGPLPRRASPRAR